MSFFRFFAFAQQCIIRLEITNWLQVVIRRIRELFGGLVFSRFVRYHLTYNNACAYTQLGWMICVIKVGPDEIKQKK